MLRLPSFLAILFLAFISACATPTYNYQPTSRDLSFPPLNETTQVAVGEAMLSQGTFAEHDGIRLSETVSVGALAAYTFSAGEYKAVGQSKNGTFYLPYGGAKSGVVTKSVLADPFQIILLKNDGQICGVSVFDLYTCKKSAAVEKIKVNEISADNFQQTLLYSGRFGDRVRISYREFSGDVARPAFNNEVEYDLSESVQIGYKGALIDIVEATNKHIRYVVRSNFNSAVQ